MTVRPFKSGHRLRNHTQGLFHHAEGCTLILRDYTVLLKGCIVILKDHTVLYKGLSKYEQPYLLCPTC